MSTHAFISYCKSAIRILGFLAIIFYSLVVGSVILIIAELVGIIEELFE